MAGRLETNMGMWSMCYSAFYDNSWRAILSGYVSKTAKENKT